jgi:hypothetical protein
MSERQQPVYRYQFFFIIFIIANWYMNNIFVCKSFYNEENWEEMLIINKLVGATSRKNFSSSSSSRPSILTKLYMKNYQEILFLVQEKVINIINAFFGM